MKVKFRDLNWGQICAIKKDLLSANMKHTELSSSQRFMIFGFVAFVNANWSDKHHTFKWAFPYFKDEHLDAEVEIYTPLNENEKRMYGIIKWHINHDCPLDRISSEIENSFNLYVDDEQIHYVFENMDQIEEVDGDFK